MHPQSPHHPASISTAAFCSGFNQLRSLHRSLVRIDRRSVEVCGGSMAMGWNKVVATAGVVCAILVLCMAADANAQSCSISQLSACTGAVTRGSNPTPQCCAQVAGIADFNCFCRMMMSQRNIPQAYINNAVRVPSKCGAQGMRLRNRQCGNVRIP